MKAPFLAAVALVAIALTAAAQTGPTSTLYLTASQNGQNSIVVVQGNSITSFPEAYGSPTEGPIAVWGDVRTTGWDHNEPYGGQYTLSGTPTGTTYVLPSAITGGYSWAFDSTSDGSHNYLISWNTGVVYQTARDFTNPTGLFYAGGEGITYDAANNSLWTSGTGPTVADYSLSGTLLSSFNTGHYYNYALALDPEDQTLWLMNALTGNLEQYSQAGVLLSIGPYLGGAYGAEFDLAPTTPEPGTLIMFCSGILGLAGVLRRKINL